MVWVVVVVVVAGHRCWVLGWHPFGHPRWSRSRSRTRLDVVVWKMLLLLLCGLHYLQVGQMLLEWMMMMMLLLH